MSFLAIPGTELSELEKTTAADVEVEIGLFEDDEPERPEASDELAPHHVDTKLQTKKKREQLLRSLLKIHSESKAFIEEQGTNVLYLALGFLEWYESETADKERLAPLVLIPVEMFRANAKEDFKVRYSGEDLDTNLSLQAKLALEFGIGIPDLPESDTEFDFDAYMAEVGQTIQKQPRWRIRPNEIHLGFFSFGKFRMYKDLDIAEWPEEESPLENDLLTSILGDGFPESTPRFSESDYLDDHVDPGEIHFVKDADSTQTIAALEVMSGKNLVIQGPPGTGKSQTITNVIAECVGHGKTVLFVSEKMAALEVVKRRLDEVHIGDAVLELHSHKTKRKEVVEELARTLNLGEPLVDDGDDDIAALQSCQSTVNEYCADANRAIRNSGLSFVQALGHSLRIKNKAQATHRFDAASMLAWDRPTFRKNSALVGDVARFIDENGTPDKNPFFLSELDSFSPAKQTQLEQLLHQTKSRLEDFKKGMGELSARLGFEAPSSLKQAQVYIKGAKRAADAPRLDGIALTRDDWQQSRDDIRALLSAGKQIAETREALESIYIANVWDADLLHVRQAYKAAGGKWWRFFSGVYRKARRDMLGLAKDELPADSEVLAHLDQVMDAQTARTEFDARQQLGADYYGSQWQQLNSDWDVLETIADWVVALYDEIGEGAISPSIIQFLNASMERDGLKEQAGGVEKSMTLAVKDLAAVRQSIKLTLPAVSAMSIEDLIDIVGEWIREIDSLYLIVRYRQLQKELEAAGLQEVGAVADTWQQSGDALSDAFALSYYEGLVDSAYDQSAALNMFDRTTHEQRIKDFKQLDQLQLLHAQGKLAKQHHASIPRISGAGQMGVLGKEINKKRRHLPIRRLLQEAGEAILRFKPVFMMSPMSIAQYLSPGSLKFDVAIFDEASQVKSVDAFGAILRSKQVVVVGDTKQMPPTDFFSIAYDNPDEDSETSDIESILGLFLAKGAPEALLKWHYRSRHDSLIAVSNYEFYDNKLVVFPSSGNNPRATGLHFHHLPDSIFDRGKSRTNEREARAVAEQVMQHARVHPEMSLGVVAFSVAQRDMIELYLEKLRRADDSLEDFFVETGEEPFFVKNLENVQGDERDAIFISVGYGRDVHGKLTKNFGPLNRDGGHRRLNVLISRAKEVMHVFSNFRADELPLTDADAFGVRALKHFLKFAETGELEIPRETGKDPDSPFEEEVISALRGEGYLVEPQVGSAGYFIDLAIRDPENPGSYLLAIECDGAAYHSARSARDRDRLRQAVLEGLGWRFHRIWSTDWFRNPAKELQRVVAAIEEAKQGRLRNPVAEPEVKKIVRAELSVQDEARPVRGYEFAGMPVPSPGAEIHATPTSKLLPFVQAVTETESPVHIDIVTRRVMASYGVTRAGARIAQAIENAVEMGVKQEVLRRNGDFLYRLGQSEFPYRNRDAVEAAERKIEYVAPEELSSALYEVVASNIDVELDDLVSEALQRFGFQRATQKARDLLETSIQAMVEQEILQSDGRYFRTQR